MLLQFSKEEYFQLANKDTSDLIYENIKSKISEAIGAGTYEWPKDLEQHRCYMVDIINL